jgi:hypothetical protein
MAMVVEQKASSFTPMPEGLHEAVFSEIKDLGEKETAFGVKRTIAARLTDAQGREATRFYTPSLHEKATLAKDLVILKGSIPAKFDIESLVNTQCQVLITEGVNGKGQPTAKVEKILKPKPKQNVAVKSFPKSLAAALTKAKQAEVEKNLEISDDDIPF